MADVASPSSDDMVDIAPPKRKQDEMSQEKVTILAHKYDLGDLVFKACSRWYSSAHFSDMILTIGSHGERISCHKVILSLWSPVFAELIRNAKPANKIEVTIDIPDNQRELFKMMILYIYTGNLQLITEQVDPLLKLAHKFGIHPLKEQCSQILGSNIDQFNVFYLLDMCDKFDCRELRKICANFISRHFSSLTNSDKMALTIDTCEELLKDDDIDAKTEEELFEWMLKYVDSQKEKKEEVLERLLPCIRFPLMKMKYVVEKVETDARVVRSKVIHELLHEAYRYRSDPKRRQTSFRTKDRKHSKERKCRLCGKEINKLYLLQGTKYVERENHDGSCKRHMVDCKCPTPYNYYPNPVSSPNCCCSGCHAVCKLCHQCKCFAACATGQHEE